MKIGIDLDGTAWAHRALFKAIIHGLQAYGHSVGILTAHINLEQEDKELWIKRDFPTVDFYVCKSKGEEGIPSSSWKKVKAKELGLDYIFDDFDTYGSVTIVRID